MNDFNREKLTNLTEKNAKTAKNAKDCPATLIIVRHGYSQANEAGYLTGQSDVPLAKLGEIQAEKTAAEIFKKYKIDGIYSSPLKRARQTAEPIAKLFKLPVVLENDLQEINAGEWEGHTPDELLAKYPKEFSLWKNDVGNARCTGGESVLEVQNRAVATLKKIAKANLGKTVAVTTHACFIRTAFCAFYGLTLADMKNLQWEPNASISVVSYKSGVFTIEERGKADHLAGITTTLPTSV